MLEERKTEKEGRGEQGWDGREGGRGKMGKDGIERVKEKGRRD